LIPITARKGIVTRPILDKLEEKLPNYRCSKCGLGIIEYPFYKNGFEKYYHIICALSIGQLDIYDMELLIRRLEIDIETEKSLKMTLYQYLNGAGREEIVKTK
jgi:hypothetical protein